MCSTLFLHVTYVQYVGDYELEVAFNDGTVKTMDLQGELYGEVFEPLKDMNFFRQATVSPETGTVEWPNGADFAPEFSHQIGSVVKQVA